MRRFLTMMMGMLFLCFCVGCGKADKYYEKGMELVADEELTTALSYLDKAIDENSEKAEYYISRGFVYSELKETDKAIADFTRAILDNDLLIARKNNKQAWRGLGIVYYENKDYEKAEEYLRLALQEKVLPELDADILMYLADAYEMKEDYVEAIKVYDEILLTRTDYSAGYRARAYMEYLLGQYSKSLADYEMAISLEPKNISLLFGKYNVLEKLERREEQKQLLEKLIAMQNRSPEDNYFIAKANYFCKNYEAAVPMLLEAVENGYADADFYLGEIYKDASYKESNVQEALYHYTAFLSSTGSEDASAYNQAAVCLMKLERYEEALETLRAGTRYADIQTRELFAVNEVVILERMGDYETAHTTARAHLLTYPANEALRLELDFLSTRVKSTSE